MKARLSKLFVTVICLILMPQSFGVAMAIPAPVLDIDVVTDKQIYNVGDTVKITGNVTLDGILQNDTLASIEIQDPYENPRLIRTVDTGNISERWWWINILDLYTCNSQGSPRTLFARGTSDCYFNITIQNIHPVNIFYVLGGVTILGSNNVVLSAFYAFGGEIYPEHVVSELHSVFIPSDAPLGEARIFISLLTNKTSLVGYPHCPERSVNFSIGAVTPKMPQQPEHFNLTFVFPSQMKLGNYTLYATTHYVSTVQTAFRTETFSVILMGDIVKDNVINVKDITACILLYRTTPASPNWNPVADTNNDKIIDVKDITFLIVSFGRRGE